MPINTEQINNGKSLESCSVKKKKKEWTVDTYRNTDESQNNYPEWKKLDRKEYTLYGFIYVQP